MSSRLAARGPELGVAPGRDAPAETGEQKPLNDEGGCRDQPDRRVRESLERLRGRVHRAGDQGQCQPEQGNGWSGQRLQDQPENRADEDGERVHAASVDASGTVYLAEAELVDARVRSRITSRVSFSARTGLARPGGYRTACDESLMRTSFSPECGTSW